MKHPLLNNIPMILETPCPEEKTYAKEVKMLYAMCDTWHWQYALYIWDSHMSIYGDK